MKLSEDLESKLAPKRKSLLYRIRENNWKVIEINDDYSNWAYDEKWIVKSTRENFFKLSCGFLNTMEFMMVWIR